MDEAEKVRQDICTRVGRELQSGPFSFAGQSLTAITDDGLLRLGRASLAVISHLPKLPFIRAIVIGCVAEAIMGKPDKYDLFKWIIMTASEPLWNEVKKEVEQLFTVNHIVTKQAAYRLLSFEECKEAYKLRQTLPQNLFPIPAIFKEWRDDPCTAPSAWTQDHCKSCLQRSDLSLHWIANRIKPHCVNPDLEIPRDLKLRLRPLIETIPIDSIWSVLNPTRESLDFDDYEPAFCAYAPDAMARFIRRVASQIDTRESLPLRQLTFQLIEHYLILTEEEKSKVYRAWERLYENDVWDKTKEETEMFLFLSVLKGLRSEEQLVHLLRRSNDALDLLKYKPSFLPITDWEFVQAELAKASDIKAIRRILWFLSAHPEVIPIDIIHNKILPLLNHDDSYVRSLVIQILYFSKEEAAIKPATDGEWAWNTAPDSEVENIWGSLLLCEHGINIPYSELRSRVHPIYLGYAVQCRGMNTDEVDQYANDIHRLWLHLESPTPEDPLIDLPPIEIDASYEDDVTLQDRRGLSQDSLSSSAKLFMRDFSWGGIEKNDILDFFEKLTSDPSQEQQDLLQIMQQAVEEQIEAGNFWFARNFHTNALDQVIHRHPELVDEWLENAFAERPEAIRRLYLSRSFYDALCTVLLNEVPDKGLKLYWHLNESNIGVRVVDHNTKIQLLDYAFFKAPNRVEVKDAWRHKIEQCKTDRELMEVASLAQFGSGRDWLWSSVIDSIQSSVPLEKTRAMALLAFIETDEAYKLLNTLLKNQPDTWVKQLLELSLQRWRMNDWTKHWFRRFLSEDDNVTAWASFRLFLRCVDTRFWHWQEQILKEVEGNKEIKARLIFFEDNLNTVKNRIRKNEQDLEKHYLGQKVLQRQAWPWM